MENTIRQVLEIEMRARKIVQEAEEMKRNMKDEALKKMQDLENNACSMRQVEIDELRKQKMDLALAKSEEIMKQAEIKAKVLRTEYEKKGLLWAKDVFTKITSV